MKYGFLALIFGAGLIGGYLWRSYFPLALPFESALVADKSSDDLGDTNLRELARAANERADRFERESKQLAARIKELEGKRQLTEREMGDLQIKSMLKGN